MQKKTFPELPDFDTNYAKNRLHVSPPPQVSATDPDSGDFGLVRYPRLLGDDPVLRGVTKVIMVCGEHFLF